MSEALEAAGRPRVIKTPKSFWVAKRTDGHRDWLFAFWRELFQNSVDAAARNVRVTVEDADGKGSWGRPANHPRVVRVTFADDGSGMSSDVLEDVFFAPGESTKRGVDGQTGGFGTARTMLCFSQARYAIRTGDRAVEGDGSEYEILPADPVRGTTFEIDIPAEEGGRTLTAADLGRALRDYADLSQFPVAVTLNGEPVEVRTPKGPARRRLAARIASQDSEGRTVRRDAEFATVHANQGEKSRHKGCVIVRVRGAAMFVDSADVPFQVVVELDPDRSRHVLTDNRDGLRWDYQAAMNTFLQELTQDKRSALGDKDRSRHQVIRGGLGGMLKESDLRRGVSDISFAPAAEAVRAEQDRVPASALRAFRPETFEERGFAGLPAFAVRGFLDRVRAGGQTFLEGWADTAEAARFRAGVAGDGAAALGGLGEDFARFLAAGIGASLRAEGGVDPRYADRHDVHVYREDDGIDPANRTPEERRLYNRWQNQKDEVMRSRQGRLMLSAWTTLCRHAIDAMAEAIPESVPEGGLRWSTGFAFARDKSQWSYRLNRAVPSRTNAMHMERGGEHVLLVNPLTSAGDQAYDLARDTRAGGGDSRMGLSDLAAHAVHEVAHILAGRHDEEYASVLTAITGAFYAPKRQRAVQSDLVRNLAAVVAAFGKGASVVQAIDLEGATVRDILSGRRRPADVLKAMAAPAVVAALGTAAAPDNAEAAAEETPALLAYIEECQRRDADGTLAVDCDALAVLDKGLRTVLSPAPEALPKAREPEAVPVPPQVSPTSGGGVSLADLPVVPAGGGISLSDLPIAPGAGSAPSVPESITPPAGPLGLLRSLATTRFSAPTDSTAVPDREPLAQRMDASKPSSLDRLVRSGALTGFAERIRAAAPKPIAAAEAAGAEFDLGEDAPAP